MKYVQPYELWVAAEVNDRWDAWLIIGWSANDNPVVNAHGRLSVIQGEWYATPDMKVALSLAADNG